MATDTTSRGRGSGDRDESPKSDPADRSNTRKDPDQWTTGSEPMTGAQRSYLRTLCEVAGEEVPEDLTKAEASKKIDELQERTGRTGGRGS